MSVENQGDAAVATVVLSNTLGNEKHQTPYFVDELEDDPLLDVHQGDDSGRTPVLGQPDVESLPTFYSAIRMAPPSAIMTLGWGIAGPMWVELLKNRVCLEEFHYAANVCSHINEEQFKIQGDAVRSKTADYQLYDTLISSVPAVFFSLLAGSWSDRFGRKLPMLLPLLGSLLASVYIAIIANFPLRPAYMLVASVLSTITGGWSIFFMAMFSYVGDNSTKKNRSVNIVILECVMSITTNAGAYLGGFLESKLGSIIPFYFVCGFYLAAILYVAIVVRDPKRDSVNAGPSGFAGLFTLSNIKDNMKMLRKIRLGDTRLHLWLVFISLAVFHLVITGDGAILQLFAEFDPIKWNLQTYTTWSAITGFANSSVAMVLMLVMRKFFHIRDTLIGFISVISAVAGYFVYGIAWAGWMMYAAAFAGVFKVLMYVSVRSLMSALVDSDEIGKSMSLISSMQAILPIFGVLIYTNLFARTSYFWPGLCFIAAAFTLVPAVAAMGYVDVARRRDVYKEDYKHRPLNA